VQTLFTAPTVLRALMKEGDHHVETTSRESLRVLGSVGEPINPEAWRWYHHVVGRTAARSSTPGGRPRPAAR
jgi:acetyl-CoA synthetase